jgi:hypothetical protein
MSGQLKEKNKRKSGAITPVTDQLDGFEGEGTPLRDVIPKKLINGDSDDEGVAQEMEEEEEEDVPPKPQPKSTVTRVHVSSTDITQLTIPFRMENVEKVIAMIKLMESDPKWDGFKTIFGIEENSLLFRQSMTWLNTRDYPNLNKFRQKEKSMLEDALKFIRDQLKEKGEQSRAKTPREMMLAIGAKVKNYVDFRHPDSIDLFNTQYTEQMDKIERKTSLAANSYDVNTIVVAVCDEWIGRKDGGKSLKFFANTLKEKQPYDTFMAFQEEIVNFQKKYRNALDLAIQVGYQFAEIESNGKLDIKKRPRDNEHTRMVDNTSSKPKKQTTESSIEDRCKGCGRDGHEREGCLFKSHPDFNTTDKPWLESRNGKLWRKKKDSKGNEFTRLPHYEQLSGDPLTKEQVAKLPKRKCECAQLNTLSEFSEKKFKA